MLPPEPQAGLASHGSLGEVCRSDSCVPRMPHITGFVWSVPWEHQSTDALSPPIQTCPKATFFRRLMQFPSRR